MINRRSILLTLGLVLSAGLVFFGEKPDETDISEPVVRTKPNDASRGLNITKSITKSDRAKDIAGGRAAANRLSASAQSEILALQERDTPFGALVAELPVSDKIAINFALPVVERLFNSQTWDPPPPPPPPPSKPIPPPPPVAPPVPFTVVGQKLEDGIWEVYLARGDTILIAREKTVLDANYRVETIIPPTLTLTYIPLEQTQTITIGGID
jgi:hypothetical protein